MTINQILSEMKKEFLQYSSEGYSGGKDGLRCFECDRKYSGEASYGQLCAVCNFHSYTRKLIESLAEEIITCDPYADLKLSEEMQGGRFKLRQEQRIKKKEILSNLK